MSSVHSNKSPVISCCVDEDLDVIVLHHVLHIDCLAKEALTVQ